MAAASAGSAILPTEPGCRMVSSRTSRRPPRGRRPRALRQAVPARGHGHDAPQRRGHRRAHRPEVGGLRYRRRRRLAGDRAHVRREDRPATLREGAVEIEPRPIPPRGEDRHASRRLAPPRDAARRRHVEYETADRLLRRPRRRTNRSPGVRASGSARRSAGGGPARELDGVPARPSDGRIRRGGAGVQAGAHPIRDGVTQRDQRPVRGAHRRVGRQHHAPDAARRRRRRRGSTRSGRRSPRDRLPFWTWISRTRTSRSPGTSRRVSPRPASSSVPVTSAPRVCPARDRRRASGARR